MRLAYVALRVHDIDAMLRFHVDGLGFQEAFRIHNHDGSPRQVGPDLPHAEFERQIG